MATESNDTSIMAAPPVDEPSYSDTNDFDLANLLYVQNIPDAPEEYQASLQANVKSTNSWLAWELTKVERAVAEKLQLKPDGTSPLPRDNSLVSKYKRTTYRTKVLDAWRKDAPWLATNGVFTRSINITATGDKINLAILHAVLGFGDLPKNPQVLNVVKALGLGVYEKPGFVQPHLVCIVDHFLDQAIRTAEAIVKTVSFNISITEVETPVEKPAHGTKDVKDKGKSYQAKIDYAMTTSKFNFKAWNEAKPEGEDQYALGKQSLVQKQLTLSETVF